MLRRRAPGVLAAAATMGLLALLAAACGSSVPPAFRPAGKVAATPSPSASTAGFRFPPDVHIEFQDPLPADPQQAAVVTTDRDFLLAIYYAQYSQGKDQRFNDYIPPVAIALDRFEQAQVAPYAVNHKSIGGTVRFYRTTVTPVPGAPQNRIVTYCLDERQMWDVNPRTRKVIPQPQSADYLLSQDAFKPMGGGKWGLIGISSASVSASYKECKR